LKDSVEESTFTATISVPEDDGGRVKQFSFTTGLSTERATFVFGAEFYDRSRIATGDRLDCVKQQRIDAATGDKYSWCGIGFPDNTALTFDGSQGNQSGSIWQHFTPGQSDVTNPLTGLPVPNWSSSFNLPQGNPNDNPCYSSGAPCTINISSGSQNGRRNINPDYGDQRERLRADLVQPVTRFSVIGRGTYEPVWGEKTNTEMYYETSFFHRHLKNTPAAEQLFAIQPHLIPQEDGTGGVGLGGLLRNPDGSLQLFQNPLNPWGSTVLNIVTFDDLNQTREVELDHFRAVFGFQGDLPGEWATQNGWAWDISASYDRGAGAADQPQLNEERMILALETQRLDPNGNVVCGVNLPQNNGQGFITPSDCVPFDLWNTNLYDTTNGSLSGRLSPEEAEYLIGGRVNTTVVEQKVFQAFVSGDVFDFPSGGTASVAIGAEARFDSISSRADFLSAKGINAAENPSTEGRTTGDRNVKEIYGEINLPIFDSLTVDLAARFTDESNFGSENTERVRITYAPVDWMSISAAYGTSFRAPNLREQFLGDQFDGVGGGADPCNVNNAGATGWDGTTYTAANDARSAQVLANCIQQGADPTILGSLGTTTIPVKIGGNVADLTPETSEQTTITLKMAPIQETDYSFDFAITYFDIAIENTIRSIDAGVILARCINDAPNLESPFCDRVTRSTNSSNPPQNFPSVIDASFVNIGEENSSGFDLNTRFSMNFEDMTLVWTTQSTFQDERSSRTFAEDALVDTVGDFGTPELRFNNTLSLTHGDFQYTLSSRYIDGTHISEDAALLVRSDACNVASASTTLGGSPMVLRNCAAASQWTNDISVSWTPEDSDIALIFGITNVFDETPPLVDISAGSNRGGRLVSSGYDQFGRSFFANASYKF